MKRHEIFKLLALSSTFETPVWVYFGTVGFSSGPGLSALLIFQVFTTGQDESATEPVTEATAPPKVV